jgi:hypothetical protein
MCRHFDVTGNLFFCIVELGEKLGTKQGLYRKEKTPDHLHGHHGAILNAHLLSHRVSSSSLGKKKKLTKLEDRSCGKKMRMPMEITASSTGQPSTCQEI